MQTPGIFKTSPHTPAHLFRANAVYIITGTTYLKQYHIHPDSRKAQWLQAFRKAAEIYGWTVIAWVVLSNHYHVLVRAPATSALNLPKFIASYHKFTARRWNDEDGKNGRQVWWNYWDTCIRTERDYLARLNYIHWNPVKHGLVRRPEEYPFSSYREYLAEQAEMLKQLEEAYPHTEVDNMPDDF